LTATKGLIQPILVRKLKLKQSYEIVAGERRWRAAKIAGISKVPVIVKEYRNEEEARLHSLIENIDREDLTSAERERAVTKLWNSGKWKTQKKLGEAFGRTESWVSHNLNIFKVRKKEKIPDDISTLTIQQTCSLSPEERRYVIGLVHSGKLTTHRVPEAVFGVKGAIDVVGKSRLKEAVDGSQGEDAKKFELFDDLFKDPAADEWEKVWNNRHYHKLATTTRMYCPACKSIKTLGWICCGLEIAAAKKKTYEQYNEFVESHPKLISKLRLMPWSNPKQIEGWLSKKERGQKPVKRLQLATSIWWRTLQHPMKTKDRSKAQVELPPGHPDLRFKEKS
jgi:ParB/RepB/Spo0J family partition protein